MMPERVLQRLDDGEAASSSPGYRPVGEDLPLNSQSRKRRRKHVQTDQGPTEVSQVQNMDRRSGEIPDTQNGRVNNQINGHSSAQSNGASQLSLKRRAEALWQTRKNLPVWTSVEEVRSGLRQKDVMLLIGETGSGKSTQIPQMLLDEPWCAAKSVRTDTRFGNQFVKVGGCIAITEPRRVAAVSLARRVAEEMGTQLGSNSPSSTVGYAVRFDNSTSPNTRIKFLTEGMLLQEILQDPWLRKYSAVIVDEVHERGVNVDVVLGFLRNMMAGRCEGRGGIGMKVVVMSATAEMEKLKAFFEMPQETPHVENGSANGKVNGHADPTSEESEWSGISSSDDDDDDDALKKASASSDFKSAATLPGDAENSQILARSIAACHIEGRQYPVSVTYVPQSVQDIVDASLRTIFQIHYKEPMPGDILVFLTGQETVESLEALVKEYAAGMGPEVPKVLVLTLFAALPQAAQQRVFEPAPPKTRKIIIATNIAETSVTVSGVRFVIDCGKAKIKHFRSRIGLEALLVRPISKSAAIQRKGRAGREAPGKCYRLYTEKDYLALQDSNTPEILRCDLSHAILTMKARGIDNVIDFPFLDPPQREGLEKALLHLYHLGALSDTGAISQIGQQIAKFPLTVSLGRALIAASSPESDCILAVIDIISCLSVESIFLNITSEEKKEQAETARKELFRREGDHLTFLATVQAYAAEHSDRKTWAERHFVSHRAMKSVMDVRKQLREQCRSLGFISSIEDRPDSNPTASVISSETAQAILRSFLKGFALNTAVLCGDGSYKTVVGKQTVAIHPSSVLWGKKVEAIMYNEFVYTTKAYAKGVSAVQMDWISGEL